MKNFKRIFSMTLALALSFTNFTTAFAEEYDENTEIVNVVTDGGSTPTTDYSTTAGVTNVVTNVTNATSDNSDVTGGNTNSNETGNNANTNEIGNNTNNNVTGDNINGNSTDDSINGNSVSDNANNDTNDENGSITEDEKEENNSNNDTHEHSYSDFASNGDGTHTKTCECGDTVTEDCVDEDEDGKCDICGYEFKDDEDTETFTVEFYDTVAEKVFYTEEVEEGKSVQKVPEAPDYGEDYIFVEYDGDYSCITKDIIIYAVYEDNTLVEKELSVTIDNYTIIASGKMPKDAKLDVSKYNNDNYIEERIESEDDVPKFNTEVAFDIKILYNDDKEYQPIYRNETVKIKINNLDSKTDFDVFRVSSDKVTNMNASNNADEVNFTTDHFTIYAVGEVIGNGTYMGFNYTIEGDTTIFEGGSYKYETNDFPYNKKYIFNNISCDNSIFNEILGDEVVFNNCDLKIDCLKLKATLNNTKIKTNNIYNITEESTGDNTIDVSSTNYPGVTSYSPINLIANSNCQITSDNLNIKNSSLTVNQITAKNLIGNNISATFNISNSLKANNLTLKGDSEFSGEFDANIPDSNCDVTFNNININPNKKFNLNQSKIYINDTDYVDVKNFSGYYIKFKNVKEINNYSFTKMYNNTSFSEVFTNCNKVTFNSGVPANATLRDLFVNCTIDPTETYISINGKLSSQNDIFKNCTFNNTDFSKYNFGNNIFYFDKYNKANTKYYNYFISPKNCKVTTTRKFHGVGCGSNYNQVPITNSTYFFYKDLSGFTISDYNKNTKTIYVTIRDNEIPVWDGYKTYINSGSTIYKIIYGNDNVIYGTGIIVNGTNKIDHENFDYSKFDFNNAIINIVPSTNIKARDYTINVDNFNTSKVDNSTYYTGDPTRNIFGENCTINFAKTGCTDNIYAENANFTADSSANKSLVSKTDNACYTGSINYQNIIGKNFDLTGLTSINTNYFSCDNLTINNNVNIKNLVFDEVMYDQLGNSYTKLTNADLTSDNLVLTKTTELTTGHNIEEINENTARIYNCTYGDGYNSLLKRLKYENLIFDNVKMSNVNLPGKNITIKNCTSDYSLSISKCKSLKFEDSYNFTSIDHLDATDILDFTNVTCSNFKKVSAKKIILPDGITNIEIKHDNKIEEVDFSNITHCSFSFSFLFSNCTNLNKLKFGDYKIPVDNLDHSFYNTKITETYFDNFNLTNCTKYDNAYPDTVEIIDLKNHYFENIYINTDRTNIYHLGDFGSFTVNYLMNGDIPAICPLVYFDKKTNGTVSVEGNTFIRADETGVIDISNLNGKTTIFTRDNIYSNKSNFGDNSVRIRANKVTFENSQNFDHLYLNCNEFEGSIKSYRNENKDCHVKIINEDTEVDGICSEFNDYLDVYGNHAISIVGKNCTIKDNTDAKFVTATGNIKYITDDHDKIATLHTVGGQFDNTDGCNFIFKYDENINNIIDPNNYINYKNKINYFVDKDIKVDQFESDPTRARNWYYCFINCNFDKTFMTTDYDFNNAWFINCSNVYNEIKGNKPVVINGNYITGYNNEGFVIDNYSCNDFSIKNDIITVNKDCTIDVENARNFTIINYGTVNMSGKLTNISIDNYGTVVVTDPSEYMNFVTINNEDIFSKGTYTFKTADNYNIKYRINDEIYSSISDIPDKLEKENYKFIGYCDKEGNEIDFSTLKAGDTIYANYQQGNKITFVDENNNELDNCIAQDGETVTVPNFAKSGYTYKVYDGGTELGTTFTCPTSNKTYTVKYNATTQTITIVDEGGVRVTDITGKTGDIINTNPLNKAGYSFKIVDGDNNEVTTIPAVDSTYIVKYTANNNTLTFVNESGDTLKTITAATDSTVTVPSFAKAGYTYKVYDGDTELSSTFVCPTADKTYTVKYEATTQTITIVDEGGNTVDTITGKTGDALDTSSLAKDGYTYKLVDSNGTEITTVPSQNSILTIIYTLIEVTSNAKTEEPTSVVDNDTNNPTTTSNDTIEKTEETKEEEVKEAEKEIPVVDVVDTLDDQNRTIKTDSTNNSSSSNNYTNSNTTSNSNIGVDNNSNNEVIETNDANTTSEVSENTSIFTSDYDQNVEDYGVILGTAKTALENTKDLFVYLYTNKTVPSISVTILLIIFATILLKNRYSKIKNNK